MPPGPPKCPDCRLLAHHNRHNSWQTGRAMLIERWERFRGVDRWPEVLAVITDKKSSYMPSRVGASRFLTWVTVEYRGSDGALRSKTIRYWMTRCSFGVGDQLYVRCSPTDPSQIYFRES